MIIVINIITYIITIRPGMIALIVIINQGLDPGPKQTRLSRPGQTTSWHTQKHTFNDMRSFALLCAVIIARAKAEFTPA